jgi:hypothetical protein
VADCDHHIVAITTTTTTATTTTTTTTAITTITSGQKSPAHVRLGYVNCDIAKIPLN